jgi:hypothetical protein
MTSSIHNTLRNAALLALMTVVLSAPVLAQQKPPTTPTAPATTTTPPKSSTPASKSATDASRFDAEAAAKSHCPTDTVVWVNLGSKIYHYAGASDYGKTKSGTYMCEKETSTEGFRAAKGEKHP